MADKYIKLESVLHSSQAPSIGNTFTVHSHINYPIDVEMNYEHRLSPQDFFNTLVKYFLAEVISHFYQPEVE